MKLHQGIFLELSEEELQFIFELIKNVILDEDSSELVKSLDVKLKQTVAKIIVACEGCGKTEQVENLVCPISNIQTPLCRECYEHRKNYNNT